MSRTMKMIRIMHCVDRTLDYTKTIRTQAFEGLQYHDAGANDPPVSLQPYHGMQSLAQAKDSDNIS
jgi:hypothetical protein